MYQMGLRQRHSEITGSGGAESTRRTHKLRWTREELCDERRITPALKVFAYVGVESAVVIHARLIFFQQVGADVRGPRALEATAVAAVVHWSTSR